MSMLALENSLKELLFVFFLVLVPTVPIALGLVALLRRRRGRASLSGGRADTTPFRLITIVGSVATLAVLGALLIVIGVRWAVAGDNERNVEPVVDGGRSDEQRSDVPQQGDAAAGAVVFREAGCADCHTLLAARATGTTGPNLDETNPDFSRVVECVTTGPGAMPSFAGELSNTEVRDVAKYVATVTPEVGGDDDDNNDRTP